MRIVSIAIDGFGQFRGSRVEPAAGLTVIKGPNEAGKTTLLTFVRAMLFRFETDRYPALAGGRRGGWLDVEMKDGRRYRIERYSERGGSGTLRILDEQGTDVGGAMLPTLLQGVEERVYRNIFAFGLEELTQFERLTDPQVAARIYGAGLGTGSVSVLEVENALRAEREQLFKPGGQNPTINTLLREIEHIDEELRERDLPAQYGEAGVRLAEVERLLAEVGAGYAEVSSERRRQARIVEGWSDWLALLEARAGRDELGEVRTFPPDTLERLGRLEAAILSHDEAVTTAEQALVRAQAAVDAARLDEAALSRRDELGALREAWPVELARYEERARTERELAEARVQVEAAIAQLGPGWSVERVEAFDHSVAVQADISSRFRTLLERADQGLTTAKLDMEVAERYLEDLALREQAGVARLRELEEELGARPPSATRERGLRDIEDLSRRLEDQRSVSAGAPEQDLSEKRAGLEVRLEQARELSTALGTRERLRGMLVHMGGTADMGGSADMGGAVAPDAPPSALYQRLVRFTGPTLLAVAGIVLAAALYAVETAAGVIIGVVVAALAGAALWTWRLRAPSSVELMRDDLVSGLRAATEAVTRTATALGLPELPGAPADTASALAAELLDGLDQERRELERLEDASERAQAAAQEVERLEGLVAATALLLGLPSAPGAQELEAWNAQVATDRELESRRATLLEQQEELRRDIESRTRRRDELANVLQLRNEEAVAAQAQWVDWLRAHGLDPGLDRETAARVVDAIGAAKAPISAMRIPERRRDDLAQAHGEFVARVRGLADLLPEGQLRDDEIDQAALAGAVTLLERRLATALDGERLRTDLERAREARAGALEEAREARTEAVAALERFVADMGVADGPTLRERIECAAQAARLEERVAGALRTLSALSGPGEALMSFEADLAAVSDVASARARLEELAEELETLETRRDELNQEAGALRNRRAVMERDAAATELRQRRADIQAQLEAAAERWSVLALAHDLLTRSRAVYEEAHRPAVVQAAERYFSQWTDGRYRRIVAPLGQTVEGVELADGARVPLTGLSRGTAEQLYLALRFGLVEHFVATSGEPLPIVMDDILVNFDAGRAERAARSIEELSRTCQVIYFTCHPTTPLNPDAETVLDRPGLVVGAQE